MDANSRHVTQLTHFDPPVEAGDSDWSPDGSKIAFQYDINGHRQSDPPPSPRSGSSTPTEPTRPAQESRPAASAPARAGDRAADRPLASTQSRKQTPDSHPTTPDRLVDCLGRQAAPALGSDERERPIAYGTRATKTQTALTFHRRAPETWLAVVRCHRQSLIGTAPLDRPERRIGASVAGDLGTRRGVPIFRFCSLSASPDRERSGVRQHSVKVGIGPRSRHALRREHRGLW